MKVIAVLFALTLAGCSTFQSFQRTMSFDGMTPAERAEKQRQAEREYEQQEAAKKNLKPGMSQEAVKNLWGDPDQVEFVQGVYIWTYENDEEPIQMGFQDDKLTGWAYDRNTAAFLKAQRENIAQQRRIAEAQEKAARAATWNAIGNAVGGAKQTNCTTNYVGNRAYTNCR